MHVLGSDRVDVVADVGATLGEGPLWDASREALLWVDIPRNQLNWLRPGDGERTSFDVGQPVGAVAPRSAGGFVLAVRDGFVLFDPATSEVDLACAVEKDVPNNRMNDGKCDSAGRFWAGTMAYDMSPGAGALYRLDADLQAVRVLDDVSVSNGLAWSGDDRTMYFIDTGAGGVDAFDYISETGQIDNRRRIVDVGPHDGLPDGMTIDAQGFLWVAVWGGWCVRRYAPDGTPDLVVELPTAQITSCAFGGTGLDELYITSASDGLSEQQRQEQPHAGAIFCVRPGVEGVPAPDFAG